MTTEPPTTPPTTDTGSTEYDPADLLDEDGKIDPGKVKSIAKKGQRSYEKVTAEDCQQWRREIDAGTTPRKTTDTVDPAVVRYHATGECEHDHGIAPVAYDAEADTWGFVQ